MATCNMLVLLLKSSTTKTLLMTDPMVCVIELLARVFTLKRRIFSIPPYALARPLHYPALATASALSVIPLCARRSDDI